MSSDSGFLAELKKRHVIRAAVAHVLVFWVLVQVADVVLPYIGVVDEPVRWALIAGVTLFPVTLIAAWFLEHPWHHLTGSRLVIDLVVIIVIAATAGMWVLRNLPDAVHTRTSMVILPFEHGSGDNDRGLSRALAFEVNNLLMKSRAIDVIAMESASSSTLEGLDVQAIADRLNVNHVLTGSVSSSTDTFSVKLRLLNAVGEVVWNELVEDSVDQLFVVQSKIATALERQLGAEGDDVVPVSNVVRERCEMPADLVALENYYTARLYIELRSETTESQQQIREAVRLYEDLIASHPTFSEAYSGLAWALHRQSYYDPEFALPREEMGRRMQSLAESAVAECATNAEAMHLLPNEYDHANPWLGTWQQLSAFVRMEPSKGEHYQQLSAHYRFTGLNNRAVEVAQTNLAMNPLSPRAMWDLAGALQYDGQLQASSDLYEQAIELGHKGMNFARMSMAIQECGARVDCLADLNVLSPNELEQVEMVRLIQREPENDAQQRESIDAALALHLKSPSDFVNMLNHMACSFEHLTPLFFELWDQNESLQQDQGFWFWPNQWLPACQSVWSDPRFPDFVAEFGFVEYWQEVGWPEACQPTADGFACGRNIQK